MFAVLDKIPNSPDRVWNTVLHQQNQYELSTVNIKQINARLQVGLKGQMTIQKAFVVVYGNYGQNNKNKTQCFKIV